MQLIVQIKEDLYATPIRTKQTVPEKCLKCDLFKEGIKCYFYCSGCYWELVDPLLLEILKIEDKVAEDMEDEELIKLFEEWYTSDEDSDNI
jgi:hypothetical protein